MKRKTKIRRSAFTLIEVVVVIVILVTLASIATPLYMNYLKDANKKAAKMGISNLKNAVEGFRMHVGRYPETLQDLVTRPEYDEENKWSGPYMEKVPRDPWGNEYEYNCPGDNDREYEIICFGPDGEKGTDDDITSFEGTDDAGK